MPQNDYFKKAYNIASEGGLEVSPGVFFNNLHNAKYFDKFYTIATEGGLTISKEEFKNRLGIGNEVKYMYEKDGTKVTPEQYFNKRQAPTQPQQTPQAPQFKDPMESALDLFRSSQVKPKFNPIQQPTPQTQTKTQQGEKGAFRLPTEQELQTFTKTVPDKSSKVLPQGDIIEPVTLANVRSKIDEQLSKGVKDPLANITQYQKEQANNNVQDKYNLEQEGFSKQIQDIQDIDTYSSILEQQLNNQAMGWDNNGGDFMTMFQSSQENLNKNIQTFTAFQTEKQKELEAVNNKFQQASDQYQNGTIDQYQYNAALEEAKASQKNILQEVETKKQQVQAIANEHNKKYSSADIQRLQGLYQLKNDLLVKRYQAIDNPEYADLKAKYSKWDVEQSKADESDKIRQKYLNGELSQEEIKKYTEDGTLQNRNAQAWFARTVGKLTSDILTLPRTFTPNDSYGWTDRLADWANRLNQDITMSNPYSSNLQQSNFQKIAVDPTGQYKVILDDDGEIKSVRLKDGYNAPSFVQEQIKKQYEADKSKFSTPKTEFNEDVLMKNAVNTMTDMGILILGSKGASLALKLGSLGQKLTTGAAIFGQVHNDIYNGAIKQKLNPSKASQLAILTGSGLAMVSYVNPLEYNLASNATRNMVTQADVALINSGKLSVSELSKQYVKGIAKNIVGENLEEVVLEPILTDVLAGSYGMESNEFDPISKEGLETMLITSLVSLPMGVAEVNQELPDYKIQSYKLGAENLIVYNNIMQDKLNKGIITQEEFDTQTEQFAKFAQRYNYTKGQVKENQRDKLVELLVDKSTLENNISTIGDKSLTINEQERLKEVDNELAQLLQQPKVEEQPISEQKEEQPIEPIQQSTPRPKKEEFARKLRERLEREKAKDVKVESAVIEIGGKIYEGKNHAEAILKAKEDGQDISNVNRQEQGKFKLSDGTIIDRSEAKQRFGQDRSELMIEQDKASEQANKDYKKITEASDKVETDIVGKKFKYNNAEWEVLEDRGDKVMVSNGSAKIIVKKDDVLANINPVEKVEQSTSTTQTEIKTKKDDIERRRQDIISRKSTAKEKFEFLENIPDGTIFRNDDGDALIVRKKITKRGTESYELVPLFLNEDNVWEENFGGLTITEKKSNGEYNINASLPQIFTSNVKIILPTDTEYVTELNELEQTTSTTKTESKVVGKETTENPALASVEATAKALEGEDVSEIKNIIITPIETLEERINDKVYKDPIKTSRWRIKDNNFTYSSKKEASNVVENKYKRDVFAREQEINKINNQSISEAYHKAKAKSETARTEQEQELVKAVEDLIAPKVAPTTNTEGETQTTEAQLQEFGVPEQDIKPVTNVLTAMVDGLRKAGLTAAKTVGEFVGIGKGKKTDSSLKQIIGERGAEGSFEEKYGVTFEQVEKLFESDYKNIYSGLERTFEELGVQQENLGNAIGDFMAEKVSRDLPSKLPNKKEKWDKDDLPRDRSLNVKPIPTKVKKVDLKTQQGKIEALKPITSKDDLRPNMQGVFHDADKKVLVATDAHKMVVIKDPTIKKTFIQDVTGKVVGLGKEIDAKYPDYSVVIPESAPIKQKVNVQQMLDETAGLARASDFFVDKDHLGIAAKITIGDKEFFFNPRLFNEVLTVFAQQGDKEVELQLSKPNRALKIESGDVTAILMPVQGYDQTLDNSVPHKEIFRRDETVDEKRKAIQNEIEYLEKNIKEAEGKLKLANDAFRKADASNYKSLEWDKNYEQRKYEEAKAALEEKKSELLGISNPIQEQSDKEIIKKAINNGEITEQEASNFIESANTDEVESVIEAIESKAESETEVELNEVVEEVDDAVKGKVKPKPKKTGISANAQYRVESGKRLIEALKDFSKAKNKRQATTAIIHEIMHPTVETIITGAKEGNAVGQKHTKTIVDEYNKANPDNKVTEEELIADNDKFVNGETTDKYRAVQEFIAEQWERYHQEGAKGFSKAFQEVLDAISEAFKSVYNSLVGKELTPELRKMFDEILGKSESLLSKEQTPPALRDVESTAKALEGVDKDPITKSISGIPLPPLEIGGYKRKPTEQYNINDPQSISEAYHKAKAKSETARTEQEQELVKAVEELLAPKEEVTKEEKPKFQTTDKGKFTKLGKETFDKFAKRLKAVFPKIKLNTFTDWKEAVGHTQLRTPNGTVYGFVKDGQVFINENELNANTLVHEYGHIFAQILKAQYPTAHKNLIDRIKQEKALIEAKKKDPNYANLTTEQLADEVLNELIGNKGETILNTKKPIHKEILDLLNRFWNRLKNIFTTGSPNIAKWSVEQFQNATIDDIVNNVTADLLSGRKLSNVSSDMLGGKTSFQQQAGITKDEAIKRNNGNPLNLAPNGKPSKLYQSYKDLGYSDSDAERLTAQVFSDNFKKWFGDWQNDPKNSSKVVDENGMPLLVYHGTNAEFNEFDKNKGIYNGFYFTAYKDYNYIKKYTKRLIPSFINIKNPPKIEPLKLGLYGQGVFTKTEILAGSFLDLKGNEVENIKSKGFDGLIGDLKNEDGTITPNIELVVFSPNQIKSATDNIGTFDSGSNDIRYQKDTYLELIEGFYSPLEKIINETKFEKLPAKQWIDKFAKGEEAKWTGLTEWLNQQQGSVSKADIQKYLKDNRIEIKEVVKGDYSKDLQDFYDELSRKNNYRDFGDWNDSDQDAWMTKRGKPKDVKFEEYQLEGEKENYKEIVIVLPREGQMAKVGDYKVPSAHKYNEDLADNRRLVHLRMNTRTDVDGNKVLFLEEIQSDWGQTGKKEGFKDDELERKRTAEIKEEISKNKTKIISIEQEIIKSAISEYNNNGNPIGSGNPIELFKDVDYIKKAVKYLPFPKTENLVNERNSLLITNEVLKDKLSGKYGGVYKMSDKNQDKLISVAPFITDTNAWTKLGLKVALKEAVKQGADKIAWTTGEQQNDRYDLSKQIKLASAKANNDGTYNLIVEDKQGFEIEPYKGSGKKVTSAEMEDIVGKDLAKRLIDGADKRKGLEWKKNMKENPEFHTISGIDLKIGGKGMKGFYGSPTEGSLGIVGNVAKSLFKQVPKTVDIFQSDKLASGWSVTVKDKQGYVSTQMFDSKSKGLAWLSEQEGLEVLSSDAEGKNYSTQHSIDITPELKAEVEGGLPLFQIKDKTQYDYNNPLHNDLNELLNDYISITEEGETSLEDLKDTVGEDLYNTLLSELGENFILSKISPPSIETFEQGVKDAKTSKEKKDLSLVKRGDLTFGEDAKQLFDEMGRKYTPDKWKEIEPKVDEYVQKLLASPNFDEDVENIIKYISDTSTTELTESKGLATAQTMLLNKIAFHAYQMGKKELFKKVFKFSAERGKVFGQAIAAYAEASTPESLLNQAVAIFEGENDQVLNTIQPSGKTMLEELEDVLSKISITAEQVEQVLKQTEAKRKGVTQRARKPRTQPTQTTDKPVSTKQREKANDKIKDAKARLSDWFKENMNIGFAYNPKEEAEKTLKLVSILKDLAIGYLQLGTSNITYIKEQIQKSLGDKIKIDDVWSQVYDDEVSQLHKQNQKDAIINNIVSQFKDGKTSSTKDVSSIIARSLALQAKKISGKKSTQTDMAQRVKELLENKDLARQAWEEALSKAKEEINAKNIPLQEKIDLIHKIEDAIGNFIAIPQSISRKAIRKGMKDVDTTIDDLIKSHFTQKEAKMNDIVKAIVDNTGLSLQDSIEYYDILYKEFNDMLSEKQTKQLEKTLYPKKITRKQKNEVQKMVEAINMGALGTDSFIQAFGEKFGLKKLNEEQVANIKKFTDLMYATDGEMRRRLAKELSDYIDSLKPMDARNIGRLLNNIVIHHALSGISTIAENIPIGSTLSTITNLLPVIIMNPIRTVRFLGAYNKAGLSGTGTKALADTLRSGYNDMDFFLTEDDMLKKGSRYYNFINKLGFDNPKDFLASVLYKIPMHFAYMASAFDNIINHRGGELLNFIDEYKLASKEVGDVYTKVLERMGYDKASTYSEQVDEEIEDIKALGMKVPIGYKQRRVKELMVAGRNKELQQQAYETIKTYGLMGQPDSILGFIYNHSLKKWGNIKDTDNNLMVAIKTILNITLGMFTRITVAGIEMSLKSTPIFGLMMSAYKYDSKTDKFRATTWEEKKRALAMQAMITGTLIAILAEMFDYDDDELKLNPNRRIDITGSKIPFFDRETLQGEDGFVEPLSFGYRKKDGTMKYVSFAKYIPVFVPLLAFVGNMRDKLEVRDTKQLGKEEFNTNSIKVDASLLLSLITDTFSAQNVASYNTIGSFLTDMVKAQSYHNDNPDIQAEKRREKVNKVLFKTFVSRPGKTLLMPNLYKSVVQLTEYGTDATETMDGVYKNSIKEFYGLDHLVNHEQLDMFGNEVKQPFPIFGLDNEDRYELPEWKMLVDKNITFESPYIGEKATFKGEKVEVSQKDRLILNDKLSIIFGNLVRENIDELKEMNQMKLLQTLKAYANASEKQLKAMPYKEALKLDVKVER